MKKLKRIILLLIIVVSVTSYAQNQGNYIDVIHLKDGGKTKGIIIEEVPGKAIKIQANDKTEYVYQLEEIEKLSKEEVPLNLSSKSEAGNELRWIDNFKKKEKGFFFGAEFLLGPESQGIRVTNGFRFSQYAKLGVAIGLENRTYFNRHHFFGIPEPVVSANLVFSGDMLNKRITPFYQAEIGYGIVLNRGIFFTEDNQNFHISNYGGPMAASVFGIKFKTKRKIEYKLGLDVRMISNFSDVNGKQEFNMNGLIGIRFGITF